MTGSAQKRVLVLSTSVLPQRKADASTIPNSENLGLRESVNLKPN